MSNLPANWETPETPGREEESGRWRSVGPILIVMGVTFALLVGSVLGSFATCGFMESKPNPAFQFFFGVYIVFHRDIRNVCGMASGVAHHQTVSVH